MRFAKLALSTFILAAPLGITVASAQPAPYGQGDNNQGQGRDTQGQGMRGFLTPELRMMMHQEQPQTDWRSMSPEQRAAMRDQMRARFAAMSDADKQKMRADLQARWDALPADQKQMIEQRIAERRARWQGGQQNQNGQNQ
jgi:hypothetical protein